MQILGVVHHVLQCPQAGSVGLGFLDRTVKVLELLARRCLPAVDGDLLRAQAVHQFVRQDVGEEGLEADIGPLLAGEHAQGNGDEHGAELGFLHVFQHDALRAFLRDDALVVGEIVGGGGDGVGGRRWR